MRFDSAKAADAGAMLVAAHGEHVGIGRLLALLYVVDRRLIGLYGRGATQDDYLAVPDLGAVPIGLARHAFGDGPPDSPWRRRIREEGSVAVLRDYGERPALSEAEREVVEAVAADYATLPWRNVRARLAAEAPEAEVRQGATRPLTLADVLVAHGHDEAAAIADYEEFDSWRNVRYGLRNR